tara:strand:+ start:907 stop:1119 length:213 start_codon:yes stop_codon:yes gene_type:complete
MQYMITDIKFDCSCDDDDWTPKDQQETEYILPAAYLGTIWDADDEEDLIEELTASSGWLIKSLDYKHILS